jgi:hypothetical protein
VDTRRHPLGQPERTFASEEAAEKGDQVIDIRFGDRVPVKRPVDITSKSAELVGAGTQHAFGVCVAAAVERSRPGFHGTRPDTEFAPLAPAKRITAQQLH